MSMGTGNGTKKITDCHQMDWQSSNALDLCSEKCSARISAGTSAIMTEDFRGFPRSLQANVRIVLPSKSSLIHIHL
jgi:hypothetical protein